jgi:protein-S-isoprenylcysteine O-methyltransferase Ste14
MAPPDATTQWYLKIPPPIWTLAMLLAAYAMQRSFAWAQIVYLRSLPIAILWTVAGILLAAWGRNIFAAAGTEIMPTSPSNKILVTHGPFRFTRNPMYTGLVLASAGIALFSGTLPFLIVPVLLFIICNFLFIPFEEAKLRRRFNDQYAEYRRRVRRWI